MGYDEVEGETWVNCNFYFSLFEGPGRPSFGSLCPSLTFDLDMEKKAKTGLWVKTKILIL